MPVMQLSSENFMRNKTLFVLSLFFFLREIWKGELKLSSWFLCCFLKASEQHFSALWSFTPATPCFTCMNRFWFLFKALSFGSPWPVYWYCCDPGHALQQHDFKDSATASWLSWNCCHEVYSTPLGWTAWISTGDLRYSCVGLLIRGCSCFQILRKYKLMWICM